MIYKQCTETEGETSMMSKMVAALRGMADVAARNRVYRRTEKELSSLTNRELADIGISRGDISRIARQHAGSRHV